MALTADQFDVIRKLVRRVSGIVLEPGKEYLVEARLSGLAGVHGSMAHVCTMVQAAPEGPVAAQVVECLTTNETSFFRDQHPFDALRKGVLPALRAARANSRSLSIWCAASSSGQEPYTIAMTLAEALPDLDSWKISFVASDLSPAVLKRAREGRYTQLEINRGLPAAMLVRYFEKQGPEWQVKERLRRLIDFREVNLLRAWPTMPPLDVIFMRNVLIYFDAATKTEIFGRLSRAMRPDGYLFLGGAETTLNLDDSFERAPVDKASCYRLKAAATAAAA